LELPGLEQCTFPQLKRDKQYCAKTGEFIFENCERYSTQGETSVILMNLLNIVVQNYDSKSVIQKLRKPQPSVSTEYHDTDTETGIMTEGPCAVFN
jgi:hypothetical protein